MVVSPDVNLYLAIRTILNQCQCDKKDDELVTHQTYQGLIESFEPDYLSNEAKNYYQALFRHEHEEFLESTLFEI